MSRGLSGMGNNVFEKCYSLSDIQKPLRKKMFGRLLWNFLCGLNISSWTYIDCNSDRDDMRCDG